MFKFKIKYNIINVLIPFMFSDPPLDKCQLTDSECLKASAQKVIVPFVEGIPEVGVEVLDPMNIESIKFDLAG